MGSLGSLLGSTFMSPVAGAAIMGIGSYLGTSQNNAQSAANINNQWLANSGLMNQQTTQNWQTMDKQNAINQELMDKQAGINSAAAQWQFDRSQQQMGELRDYNTSMANTAYQRSVADMRAAGLNPILGVASGGAATPGLSANAPAAPTVGSSGVGSPGTGLGSVGTPQTQSALAAGIASAAQGAKLLSGIKEAQATAQNAETQGDILTQNVRQASANADRAISDARTAKNQADWSEDQAAANAGASSAQQYKLRREAQDIEKKWESDPYGPKVQLGIPGVANVSGSASTVRGAINNAIQYISPTTPSTVLTPPSFQRYTPRGWSPTDAPQSLYSTP